MNNVNTVFLHTGSNLGNKAANLKQAGRLIEERIGPIQKESLIYITKAWGITDQPDFLNQALEIQTDLDPFELLKTINSIEADMGRKREIKWGTRLIDIDILFYEDQIIETEKLIIPHAYLHYRNFVLIPLQEIAPEFQHPIFKKTITELCSSSQDDLIVEALAV